MQAAVGDRLHVHANIVGHPERAGSLYRPRTRRSAVSWGFSQVREIAAAAVGRAGRFCGGSTVVLVGRS